MDPRLPFIIVMWVRWQEDRFYKASNSQGEALTVFLGVDRILVRFGLNSYGRGTLGLYTNLWFYFHPDL